MTQQRKPNRLIHEKSPYLRQHAYNPVDWYPWGEEALQKARDEDKPIIISIGYSACHWCHMMAHESFENEDIAEVMNYGFVCIKVDREERPDIDQVYMEAVQAMGLPGGWPLNVFAMPDQRPFYGGTYFRPQQWMHILKSIIRAFTEDRHKLEESAGEFARTLSVGVAEKYGLHEGEAVFSKDDLRRMTAEMKVRFDKISGGLRGAPKFPNPSVWQFLLTADYLQHDSEVRGQVMHTLRQMARGGIYDQLGGGFARYSVDERWLAPHFEKMLYDNAQLVSLYSQAYQVTGEGLFQDVVYETVDFVERELTSPEHGFYSALDADSEGEEGKFYVWSAEEIDEVLGDDASWFKDYFNVRRDGNWERGKNIFHRTMEADAFAKERGMEPMEFRDKLKKAKSRLFGVRARRVHPGLDDKVLAAWNGLMIRGLSDAWQAFGEKPFLHLAWKNGRFLMENLIEGNALWRTVPTGEKGVRGFLDDYAFVIEAFIALYQGTFERSWLDKATELTGYAVAHFYDQKDGLFYYTDDSSANLIARKKEIFDNVIPASNSAMAKNLFLLGQMLGKDDWTMMAENMLAKVAPLIKNESGYLANWASLLAMKTVPFYEIAVIGPDHLAVVRELQNRFIPNKIILASELGGTLPLLRDRTAIDGKTTIYVCFNKSCKLPVHSVAEALKQIHGN